MFAPRNMKSIRVILTRRSARALAGWALLMSLAPEAGVSRAGQRSTLFDGVKAPGAPAERRPTELLETLWPGHPEGLAMVVEILAGGQAAPGRGWYKKGVSRTRFDWKWASERLDRDRDSTITRDECQCPDFDFQRLDRDRSGTLTKADFEFPSNELATTRSKIVLSFADRDGNGKVDRNEFDRMIFMATRDPVTRTRYFADSVDELRFHFKQSQREGFGFLSLSDLQETIDRLAVKRELPQPPNPDSGFEVTSKEVLFRALVRRDLGSVHPGPSLDDPAPDFTLPAADGREDFTLSKRVGSGPIVLIFGSFSCAPFRNEAGSLEKLYRRYRDRARFLVVYVRESNPIDGWRLATNDQAGITLRQPRDERERAEAAKVCMRKLELEVPMVVDTLDDRVGCLYAGVPSRLYLLDRQGRISYKGGRGPFGFKPAELEQSLLLLLQADPVPKPPESVSGPAVRATRSAGDRRGFGQ